MATHRHSVPAFTFCCHIFTVAVIMTSVGGQSHLPMRKLRKETPVAMLGQSNDIYQSMEGGHGDAQLEDGMALLYASAPIYSPLSKDPEEAAEVYAVLTETEAVRRGVDERRLLEDALIEMGFPLEQITAFDARNGRLLRITDAAEAAAAAAAATPTDGSKTKFPSGGAQAILHALQAPLPYVRRGPWGR